MTSPKPTLSDDTIRFPSLESLRAAHTQLLKDFRANSATPEVIAKVEHFIRRGKATGVLLDADADRWAAQSELDYWATQLYKPSYEPPDATLDEFDPQLAPTLDDVLCPYVGLDAFREVNESIFFGRARLVSELVHKLTTTRFLAVLGSSGSGKSSVVRAGLIPELKKRALTDHASRIFFPPMVPGSQPLKNLARLLMLPEMASGQAEIEAESYRENPAYLPQVVAERFKDNVLLVIDQFEEIFTLCTDEVARQRFVDNLMALCHAPDAQHCVIITMRSDFETNIARLPSLHELFEQGTVRITPLTASELREAIEAPAARIGLKFEEGVVNALLSDTLGEPAALPLLQFTLLKLWETRDRNRVTWEAYKKLGGGRQALARSADQFYNRLIPEDQVAMRRILLKMVRPGEGLEITSNRVPRASLYQKAEANDRIDRVLDRLIRARLVRASEGDMAADAQVEIAHEALIRNWPLLVEWLEEERVTLRQRQRLTASAEQWDRLNRAPSALWRGVLLEEARRYDDLSQLEKEFVEAGYEAEQADVARALNEARQQRELEYAKKLAEAEKSRAEEQAQLATKLRQGRLYLIGALGVVVLLGILAVDFGIRSNEMANTNSMLAATNDAIAKTAQVNADIALTNAEEAQKQANIALGRQLAAQAQSIYATRSSKRMVAVLLALQSMKVLPSGEAAQILQTNTLASEITRTNHNGFVMTVACSPDGKYVVSGSQDNTVRVWDAVTGNTIAQMTHDDYVYSAQFSPDGKYVVSGSWDNTARVWGVSTSREIAQMVHDDDVNSVAFSPDGKYVVSGSNDGTARIWETLTGKEIARMVHNDHVTSASFSPDGKYVVSGSWDNTARVWEVSTSREIAQMSHDFYVFSVAFSPNGKYIVSGSGDYTARVWEVDTGEELARMTHESWVNSVAFSPDGIHIVSGSWDATARMWGAFTGQEVARMTHDAWVNSVAFSPDGKYVVSGSWDATARVWEAVTGREVAHITHDNFVDTVAFSPDGKSVVTGSRDSTARVWEAATRHEVARLTQKDRVSSLAFSPDGDLVVSGSNDDTALVWDANTGKEIAGMIHDGFVNSVAFSPDGDLVVSASNDATARVWKATTGKEIVRMKHDDKLSSVAFSPDGKYVVSGSWDNTARVWKVSTGRQVAQMIHGDDVNSVAFSPDGKYVVSGSNDGTARIWETLTGKEIARANFDDKVTSVAISPDGKYVVSGSWDQTLRLWDATTGQEVFSMKHDGIVSSSAFSPDGKYLVSGSSDATARIWEVDTGEELARMTHDGNVLSVAFSPDRKYVVSGSADYTARVWDAFTGQEVARTTHNRAVASVAFSPNGRYVFSGSWDGTTRIWMYRPEDLIADACARVTRNLTRAEWKQYFGDVEYRAICQQWPLQ